MLSYSSLGYGLPAQRNEQLPFTLKLVRDEESLAQAVSLRHRAYARHVPEFAAGLTMPESADRRTDSVVLLAESKLDGQALGTMRIQTNALIPLALEESVALPAHYQGMRLAEATRLAIVGSRDSQLAKMLMFKAFYLLCMAWGVDRMVVTARRPIDRIYESLMFTDMLPEGGMVPMRHVGGMPHRVMTLDVAMAEISWRSTCHPLTAFFLDTDHPDLQVKVPEMFMPMVGRRALVPPPSLPTPAHLH